MTETKPEQGRKVSGLFDIRNIIGALLAIYGVVLIIAGIAGDSKTSAGKDAGIAINLWTGIVMLLAAIFFIVWARLRPVVVPPEVLEEEPDTQR
jgi:drug/metabolite transporter (DMT)-like permease